jgi:hypothetical protein
VAAAAPAHAAPAPEGPEVGSERTGPGAEATGRRPEAAEGLTELGTGTEAPVPAFSTPATTGLRVIKGDS